MSHHIPGETYRPIPDIQEMGSEHTSAIVIHYTGSADQTHVQDQIIEYLNASGWRTIGIPQEQMTATTDTWDDRQGITLAGIETDKANRLIENIRKIFANKADLFRLDVISETDESKTEMIDKENIPEEIQTWLSSFEEKIAAGDIVDTANSLCMLGAEDPHHCTCESYNDGVLQWIHEHHQSYNTLIWNIIKKHNLIEALAEEYTKDCERPFSDPEKIATPPYDKILLTHFITDTPDPTWIRK